MTTQECQASARLQDLSESCPTTDIVLADKRDILAVCKALKRSEDLREQAEARVIKLVEYKQRVEVSMKACESFISDEVIRRKQAEALRRWDEQKVDGMSALEYAAAIRRGEVTL